MGSKEKRTRRVTAQNNRGGYCHFRRGNWRNHRLPGTKGQDDLPSTKRTKILKDREESWRLRSRAIWLKEGDDNTKLYHKHENGRKAINTIWELKNGQGIPRASTGNLPLLPWSKSCALHSLFLGSWIRRQSNNSQRRYPLESWKQPLNG